MLKKFFVLTFIFSWILTGTIALQVHKVIPFTIFPYGFSWLAGLIPGIVAVLISIKPKEFFKENILRSLPHKGIPIILLLTIGFLGIVYAVHQFAADPIRLQGEYSFLASQFVVWGILAFGEELGWRGFALPQLASRYSFFKAALILGIIWCAWHYPKILGSPYIKDWTQAWKGIAMFSVQILAGNFILCWLYFKFNNSVWMTTLYHTLWNLVSTIYLFMAMDSYATVLIVAVATAIIIVDRKLFFGIQSKPVLVETSR
jgi:membrane protease YdiL (CAAX protease family)